MKKLTLIIIAFVILSLLLMNGILLWRFSDSQKTIHALNKLQNINSGSSIALKEVSNDFMLANYLNDYQIDNHLKVKTKEGDSLFLREIIDNKNKLIVRFSYQNCGDCIRFQLNMLKEFYEKIGSENILFIASYDNLREREIDKGIHDIKNEIYSIDISGFNIYIEEENIPYLFIIDKNMCVRNIFIPRKEIPDLTKKYMEVIVKKYFSK